MPRTDASVVLYAADLDDLRAWIGCGDPARLEAAWTLLREDPDADWSPEELELLRRLLERLVMEGRLYEGLSPDERYYLTQILIDLFDEYAEPDPLSEDIPFDALLAAVESLPPGTEAARMAAWLVRGRELGGDGFLWTGGPVEEVLAYFGYLTREEAPRFVAALDAVLESGGRRGGPPGGGRRTDPLLQQLRAAAEECARAELDLVSFVG